MIKERFSLNVSNEQKNRFASAINEVFSITLV